jgi:DNA replication and repair protein RecF
VTAIRRLVLSNFRNYEALDLAIEAPMIALVGENGAGKSNILEAISLFTPGRGLRRAELDDIQRKTSHGGFAASIELQGALGRVQLGIGFDGSEEGGGRKCRIDREPVGSSTAFADHCRIIWLTPDNDALFRGPAGDRRRFLDRLVLAVDSRHGSRVNAMEKALRSRNRLLEDRRPDGQWLDAIERELAETAIAVAAARLETVSRLASVIAANADPGSPFPSALLSLEGDLEKALAAGKALDVEDWYRNTLKDNRLRDQAAGRTLIGPNTSDLAVHHGPKDMPAERCSTGEQKALLVGLMLAHCALVEQMSGAAPLLLLDEVAAHLDKARRIALYERLAQLGGQVWLTGTDPVLFEPDKSQIQLLQVASCKIVAMIP